MNNCNRLYTLMLLVFTWVVPSLSQAQQVKVVSLEETVGDVATAEGKIVDNNFEPCALLKIRIKCEAVNIKSDWMVRLEPHQENETWVWLCAGTRDITVTSQQFLPLSIAFSEQNPNIRSLRGKHTYSLTLNLEEETHLPDGIEVDIKCNVSNIMPQIDGRSVSLGKVILGEGRHLVTVSAEGYEPYADTLDVNPFVKVQSYSINLVKAINDYSVYIKNGDSFCQKKQYSKAIQQYRMAVEHKYGEGFFRMGQLYARGWGVEQDFVEAYGWYLKGSNLGYAPAINALGELYRYGYGVERDYTRSRSLFMQASAKGNITALASLGDLYEHGYGVPKNADSALYFYNKASKANDAKGMRLLADTYFNYGAKKGNNMCEQLKKAEPLYIKAAEKGDDIAMATLAIIHLNYDCVGAKLSKSERQAAVQRWWKEAETYNNPPTFRMMGDYYSFNEFTQIAYYQRAAKYGDEDAMNRLGRIYQNLGFDKEARAWYRKAANDGNAYAYYKLGDAMRVGSLGYEQNIDSTLCYYLKAITYGLSGDAKMFCNEYFSAVAKNRVAIVAYSLGSEFETGHGTGIDLEKAIRLYRIAARKDHQPAKEALDRLGVSY